MSSVLSFDIGYRVDRQDLHAQFGGRIASRVSPSPKSGCVFLFLDHQAISKSGCRDGWKSDGCYHFTGEGLIGDQLIKGGNLSITSHLGDSAELHLFAGAKGIVEYIGQFQLDSELPYYRYDVSQKGGGERALLAFRLRPVGFEPQPSRSTGLFTESSVEFFDVHSYPGSNGDSHEESVRRKLIERYSVWSSSHGDQCVAVRVQAPGECDPVFADVFVPGSETLVGVCGSVTRSGVRGLIGELTDLERFLDVSDRRIIFPFEPRYDLLGLVASQGVVACWPGREGLNFSADPTDYRPMATI